MKIINIIGWCIFALLVLGVIGTEDYNDQVATEIQTAEIKVAMTERYKQEGDQ